MKTIIYILLGIFILGMLPLNAVCSNEHVSVVLEAVNPGISEDLLKQSSDIMSARLNEAGITSFDINMEPGRIIVKMDRQYLTSAVKKLLIEKGRLEFRESATGEVLLKGKDVEHMEAAKDAAGNPFAIIQFRKEAIPLWTEATRKNLNKTIQVVMDNKVIYDPLLREVIPNGSCVIAGQFELSELQYFSILTNSGELPADFRMVE